VLLLLLGLDLIAMHLARRDHRPIWHFLIFLAVVTAATLALDRVIASLFSVIVSSNKVDNAYAIMPAWYALPFYALLRLVPSKIGGIVLVFAALLTPLVSPWMRADALRTGRRGWLWLLSCVLLAAAWIGLGVLGSLPPKDTELLVARLLAAFYFAFFLVFPFVHGRLSRTQLPAMA
jgi:ubiquinol-cytochrome c reductase cytochrome b/c1 subunit